MQQTGRSRSWIRLARKGEGLGHCVHGIPPKPLKKDQLAESFFLPHNQLEPPTFPDNNTPIHTHRRCIQKDDVKSIKPTATTTSSTLP